MRKQASTDVHSPKQRSYNMSRIRGANTQPELLLRKALWRRGLRYRITTKLPGRPDIVFAVARVAVFMDGCFWHGCKRHLIWPKNNAAFWRRKISDNQHRDAKVRDRLRQDGWCVIRFWEHDVQERLDRCVAQIYAAVRTRTDRAK